MGSKKNNQAVKNAVEQFQRSLSLLSCSPGHTYREAIRSSIHDALGHHIAADIDYVCIEVKSGQDDIAYWKLSACFSLIGRSISGTSKVVCVGVGLEKVAEDFVREVVWILTRNVRSARKNAQAA